MPTVLVVGQQGEHNLEGFISRAFVHLGWTVKRFDMYDSLPSSAIFREYLRVLSARSYGLHVATDIIARLEKRIIPAIQLERPDIVLVFKGEIFPAKAVSRVNTSLGARSILWFPDDPRYMRSLLFPIAPFFDSVIVSSKSSIPLLRDLGMTSVIHLPFACDPEVHRKFEVKKEYDITFVGSYYPERARLLRKLSRLNLSIWGKNWRLPWTPDSLRKRVVKGDSHGARFVEILNRSRISINIHHRSDLFAEGKVNMRAFEIAGCGAFQLTDRPEGLEQLFKCGQEVACYNSAQELVELAEHYLEAAEERNQIASAGQRRAYRDHTYLGRVLQLIDEIGAGH